MERSCVNMKNKAVCFLVMIVVVFCAAVWSEEAFADSEYFDLTYHTVRYEQEGGKGTNIWYAMIPASHRMHYAYAQDKVMGREKPSENAARHGATLGINTQLLGFPIINGERKDGGEGVAGYDFVIEQNPNPTTAYDVFNVYGTDEVGKDTGISFKGINLGFDYYGNKVPYEHRLSSHTEDGDFIYMSLFSQLVQDGVVLDFDGEQLPAWYDETQRLRRAPRTWLAYDSLGNQYVGVSAGRNEPLRDGAQLSQLGLTYREIIDVTRRYMTEDIYTLYNLDGGGSSGFIYHGEKLNPDYDNSFTTERKNFGLFYWKVETQVVSFANDAVMKKYGDESFTNAATTTGDGEITYSSSDPDIAIVDNTGEVTIRTAGTVTITAKASATANYGAATADYKLTIRKQTSQAPVEILEPKNGVVGRKLSSIDFTTLGLSWVDPDEAIEEGSNSYLVNYTTNNDLINYSTEQFEVLVLGEVEEGSEEASRTDGEPAGGVSAPNTGGNSGGGSEIEPVGVVVVMGVVAMVLCFCYVKIGRYKT